MHLRFEFLTLIGWQMSLFQIAVRERNQPPDDGKRQPGQYKTGGKHQQRPAPLRIHQCGENVLQKTDAAPRQFLLQHIAFTIFLHGTPTRFARASGTQSTAATKKKISKFNLNQFFFLSIRSSSLITQLELVMVNTFSDTIKCIRDKKKMYKRNLRNSQHNTHDLKNI